MVVLIDDFLVAVKTKDDLDTLAMPLKNAWNIKAQELTVETPLETKTSVIVRDDLGESKVIQHAGLKITIFADGSIKIPNPKIIEKMRIRPSWMQPTVVRYTIIADLSAAKSTEQLAHKLKYQRGVGTLRFVSNTTHPAITRILGMLGRHLHNPANGHHYAIKPVFRYLRTRLSTKRRPNFQRNITRTRGVLDRHGICG